MRYSNKDYEESKIELLSHGEIQEGIAQITNNMKPSQYRIFIDGSDKGTIMEVSIGHAAKSALLNLEIEYAHELRVESVKYAEMGAICTYYDAYIYRGMFFYDKKE